MQFTYSLTCDIFEVIENWVEESTGLCFGMIIKRLKIFKFVIQQVMQTDIICSMCSVDWYWSHFGLLTPQGGFNPCRRKHCVQQKCSCCYYWPIVFAICSMIWSTGKTDLLHFWVFTFVLHLHCMFQNFTLLVPFSICTKFYSWCYCNSLKNEVKGYLAKYSDNNSWLTVCWCANPWEKRTVTLVR